jgi:golgi apparatus protein 1
MAFWDYKTGSALTQPCDDDVAGACPSSDKGRSVFTIGAIGRCLTKRLASGGALSPGCRKLVSVAAPKDVRAYLLQVQATRQ